MADDPTSEPLTNVEAARPPLQERRGARRLRCAIPTMVEVVGARSDPSAGCDYERVEPPTELLGQTVRYTIREVSASGAFLEGPPLPLLSRVRFAFTVAERGLVEAEGWVMGRRVRACEVSRWDGPTTLPPGIGVLFDVIPMPARVALADSASE